MRYLADTHLLLWAGRSPERLSKNASSIFTDAKHEVCFSTVSIWETSIKYGLGIDCFTLPPEAFRRGLLGQGYRELLMTSEHAIAVGSLPPHHGDPFDRMLVAQALIEGVVLLTSDKVLARYPGTMRV